MPSVSVEVYMPSITVQHVHMSSMLRVCMPSLPEAVGICSITAVCDMQSVCVIVKHTYG